MDIRGGRWAARSAGHGASIPCADPAQRPLWQGRRAVKNAPQPFGPTRGLSEQSLPQPWRVAFMRTRAAVPVLSAAFLSLILFASTAFASPRGRVYCSSRPPAALVEVRAIAPGPSACLGGRTPALGRAPLCLVARPLGGAPAPSRRLGAGPLGSRATRLVLRRRATGTEAWAATGPGSPCCGCRGGPQAAKAGETTFAKATVVRRSFSGGENPALHQPK